MGNDVATTGFREIPGQGILLEDRNALRAIDVFSLPTLAGISLQESDLIIRINSIPVDTLQEAARIGQSAVRQYREDPSSGVLRIEVVNAFERKVFVF